MRPLVYTFAELQDRRISNAERARWARANKVVCFIFTFIHHKSYSTKRTKEKKERKRQLNYINDNNDRNVYRQ